AKMDEMAARPARPAEPRSGDGGAPGAASGNAGGQADQVFKTAYADFSKGNYELALLGFTEYLTANPGAPLAEDAQYWTGECLYSQGKFKEAAEAFDRCGARHPGGARAAAAMLKKGYSQIEGGQASQGIATLQKLIETHPQTDEARLAAERLKTLGLRTR
ncbi:MAG TPA: tol-pal system protein YbgF, partial [Candidatus Polarisedimenticolia bacterium]|nr:tol-pal system protein YbgF [Candidatus Polarisedimenticolia bacterium]